MPPGRPVSGRGSDLSGVKADRRFEPVPGLALLPVKQGLHPAAPVSLQRLGRRELTARRGQLDGGVRGCGEGLPAQGRLRP